MSYVALYVENAGTIASANALLASKPNDVSCRLLCETNDISAFQNTLTKVANTHDALLRLIRESVDSIDSLVLGPNHDSNKTQRIIACCEELNIPSIFVTDHWGRNVESISSEKNKTRWPTLILSIDSTVEDELAQISTDQSLIKSIGHLGIRHKLDLLEDLNQNNIRQIRDQLGLRQNTIAILVVLEVIIDDDVSGSDQYWLIPEIDFALRSNGIKNATVIVRPHPSDTPGSCKKYLDTREFYNSIIICPSNLTDWQSLVTAQLVVGSNSTLLALSAAFGVPSIVMTYGLGTRSTIPHLKNHRVASQKQLIHRMKNAMNYTNTDIGAKFVPPETLSNAWSAIRSVDSY